MRNDAKRCEKIHNEMKRNDAIIVRNESCFASKSEITKKLKMRNGRTLPGSGRLRITTPGGPTGPTTSCCAEQPSRPVIYDQFPSTRVFSEIRLYGIPYAFFKFRVFHIVYGIALNFAKFRITEFFATFGVTKFRIILT